MVDIAKQIAYWRDSANEDWAVARQLGDDSRIRYGLFFAALIYVAKAEKVYHWLTSQF